MVLAVSTLTLAVTDGSWYAFSVYFVAILLEYGWSRANTASIFSISFLMAGVFAPLAGTLVDRFGARRVLVAGALLLSIGLAGSSLATQLWHFYVMTGLIVGAAVACVGLTPNTVLLTQWFVRWRGLAIGIMIAGAGLGYSTIIPAVQAIVQEQDWRIAYVALGAFVFIALVPANFLVQRQPRQTEAGGAPATEDADLIGSPQSHDPSAGATAWGERIRSTRFWLLSGVFAVGAVAVNFVLVHAVVLLVDIGYAPALAASIYAVLGLMGSVGKLLWGALSERWSRAAVYRLGALFMVSSMGILALFLAPGTVITAFLAASLFGLGYACRPITLPLLAADHFESQAFGSTLGALNMGIGVGGALGAWAGGLVRDQTGSYDLALLGAALTTIAAWILVELLEWRKPRLAPVTEMELRVS
jgi:MFS family permease